MQSKVAANKAHWRDEEKIKVRYEQACKQKHIESTCYDLTFSRVDNQLTLHFQRNVEAIESSKVYFGKNVIITDNLNWSTDEIVCACNDRYIVEHAFRQSKDDDLVSVFPIRHWTDSKIRCHFLTCIIAMAYLRLIELQLLKSGLHLSATTVMEEMRALHSCIVLTSRKSSRVIEQPTAVQKTILAVFGCRINASGVLQDRSA